ncbi:MAG: ABC transporter permease [Planctomycetes bacterium]|nr:ABC transporter permease [Planctomycetota bacterium]
MLAEITQVVVFQSLAVGVAALLVAAALAALLFSFVQTFRRAAVLPLAVRYACSRWINIVSVAGVALGVAAIIVVMSVMNGFISTQRRMIRGSLSDLTIQPRAVPDGNGSSRMPGSFEEYQSALEGCPHVVALAPRFIWYGLLFPKGVLDIFNLGREGQDFAAKIIAVDPNAEFKVSEFRRWISPVGEDDPGLRDVERRIYTPPGDLDRPFARLERSGSLPKDALLLGVSKAYRLRLQKADRVEITTFGTKSSRENPTPPNQLFDVVGMFHTGDQEFDSTVVLITIPSLQKLLSTDVNFTEIAVKLDDYRNADAAREEIGKRLLAKKLIKGRDYNGLPSLKIEIQTWEEQKQNLLAAVDNERSLLGFILFFIVIVATFIQFATLSMMVNEKTRDIGILSTLGASWGEILAVFVDLGVAMSLAGEIAGVALGLFLARESTLAAVERFLEDRFGLKMFNPDVYLLKSLPSEVDLVQVAIIAGATLVAGVLFAIVPAVRAARLDPARALRYE